MKVDQQVEALIAVASRLIDLLDREIEILRDMRPAALDALRDEKFALIATYENSYRALAENREALALVEPALQQEFDSVARRFASALAANGRALTAAKVAQERFMRAIVDAVQATQNSAAGYAADGSNGEQQGARPVSLSLDCRL